MAIATTLRSTSIGDGDRTVRQVKAIAQTQTNKAIADNHNSIMGARDRVEVLAN
jgi:hypothetical protein